jgi:hypothetical protein
MSRRKYLSLEEARKNGKIILFAKEHPSKADRGRFDRLLGAMAKGILEDKGTLPQARGGGSSGTRTRKGT